MLHLLNKGGDLSAKAQQLVLTRLALNCAREKGFRLLGQVGALRLQREVNAQHVELSVHFNVPTVLDIELEELLVFVSMQLLNVFSDDFDKLIEQREYVEALEDATIKGILLEGSLNFRVCGIGRQTQLVLQELEVN